MHAPPSPQTFGPPKIKINTVWGYLEVIFMEIKLTSTPPPTPPPPQLEPPQWQPDDGPKLQFQDFKRLITIPNTI